MAGKGDGGGGSGAVLQRGAQATGAAVVTKTAAATRQDVAWKGLGRIRFASVLWAAGCLCRHLRNPLDRVRQDDGARMCLRKLINEVSPSGGNVISENFKENIQRMGESAVLWVLNHLFQPSRRRSSLL